MAESRVAALVEIDPVGDTARLLAGVEFVEDDMRACERALGGPLEALICRFMVALLNS